jgi:hypothetical protein
MPRKLDPKSKAGFVRSLPATMSVADVVKAAKSKGIKLDVAYVYSVRGAMKAKKKKAKATTNGHAPITTASSSGLVGEIERIVEAKVSAMLKERLGALFG